ncbi:MAG: hypothetical protein KDD66_02545 [Bdellovibrionales bacterium]|nr:hypothetical protein [Bdellovibrionales bacterium]
MSPSKRGMPYGEPLDSAIETSRLVRCSCAEIYDSLHTPKCPACGAVPPTQPSLVSDDSPSVPTVTQGSKAALPPETPEWIWKAGAAAAALLMLVMVVKDIRACNPPVAMHETAQLPETKSAKGQEAQPKQQDALLPAVDPKPIPNKLPMRILDIQIIGEWEAQISTKEGLQPAKLSVKHDQHYSFVLQSPTHSWTHSGTIYTSNGKYFMEEQQPHGGRGGNMWKDSGPYTIHNINSFSTNGSLKVTWNRVNTQPAPRAQKQSKKGWPLKKLWGGGDDYWNSSGSSRGVRR